MTTAQQTRAIHALRREIAGLDDAAYRDLLRGEFRVASSSDLDDARAGRLIERLKGLAGQGTRVGKRAPSKAADAPLLQALWISLWNIGAARSKDDAALIAFVRRQTGAAHPRFLTPAQTTRVVEALRAWLTREGVDWTESDDPKRCVVAAIARKAAACGAYRPWSASAPLWPDDIQNYAVGLRLPPTFAQYRPGDWDALANILGAKLRKALKEGT